MNNPGKTKIIVLGANGRMGQAIIRLLEDNPELELAGAVDREAYTGKIALHVPFFESMEKAVEHAPDAVIIDFSSPGASVSSARIAVSRKIPMVIGTTGLDAAQKGELEKLASQSPILWSPNMSVGINVLASLLPSFVRELGESFDMEVVEVHHSLKKDAPSGTALMLADEMAKARGWDSDGALEFCRHGQIGPRPKKQIGVQAVRGGDVPGIHTVYFLGSGECLKLEHVAESRETFAHGALRAAKWISGQNAGRLYSMRDVVENKSGH